MIFRSLPSVVALLLSISLPSCLGSCYRPDLSEANSEYQPCYLDRPSMCCATNRDGRIDQNKCRPDGLCWQIDCNPGTICENGNARGLIWRESCTDPTWTDPACLRLCVDNSSDTIITLCGDGSYCCGFNQTDCCLTGGGFWISGGKVYPYRQNPFHIGTVASTASATSSARSTKDKSFGSDRPLHKTLAFGIGIGIGIPLVLLLAGLIHLLHGKKSNHPASMEHPPLNGYEAISYRAPASRIHQELGSTPRFELQGGTLELEDNTATKDPKA